MNPSIARSIRAPLPWFEQAEAATKQQGISLNMLVVGLVTAGLALLAEHGGNPEPLRKIVARNHDKLAV
jgi:hypothetical protein